MPPSRNDVRNDIGLHEATTTAIPCPLCHNAFTPIRRQKYCTPACRQGAWRARHHPAPAPAVVLPPRTPKREITIYECPGCATHITDGDRLGAAGAQCGHRPP